MCDPWRNYLILPVVPIHHPAHAANIGRGGKGLGWRSVGKYLQVVIVVTYWAGRRFFGADGCG